MKVSAALAILVISLYTPLSYAEYVAEDLGLDLYSKIDAGASELKLKLTQKRIQQGKAKAKLNLALGNICHDAKGKSSICLSDKEFSAQDMQDITNGNIKTFQNHVKQGVVLSTDDVAEIMNRTKELFNNIQKEVSEEQERLEKMGTLGIYTDGSLKNSSYDLSADLENIHRVLFAKDIPYPGVDNMFGSDGFANFLSNEQHVSLGNLLNNWKDSPTTGPRIIGSESSRRTNSSGSTTSLDADLSACQPAGTPALDADLLADIASTLTTGSSNESTVSVGDTANSSGSENGGGSAGWSSGNNNSWGGGDVKDSFPCTGFFCIKIGIETGEWYLLGGGKSDSIEWVLDKNLKVVDKFKDSSFIAARFTNDFFELSLKNLNLGALAHIGVVVSSLPAPILNLDPSQTPRGSGPTDEEREFEELQSWVLKEFGFDPIRENDVDSAFAAYKLNASAGLSTDELAAKRDAIQPSVPYVAAKEAEIQSRFPDGFSKDLLELSAFSRTFHDYLKSLVSLSEKYNDIPQGGK